MFSVLRRQLLASFAPLALIFLVCAALTIPQTAVATPAVKFGIEQNGGMAVEATRNEILDLQKNAGAQLNRFILRFDRVAVCDPTGPDAHGVAPTSPVNPCYNFGESDAVITGSAHRGMTTLLSVYGVPSWQFQNAENWTGNTEAEFAAFQANYANFVQAAAERYSGTFNDLPRVSQWTIWNEPNGQFWAPLRDAERNPVGAIRYAALYAASAPRIKAANPKNLVAVGPTAPASKVITPTAWTTLVLNALDKTNAPVDAWAHNGYMGAQSPFTTTIKAPIVGVGNMQDITRRMDKSKVAKNKPVWITEFGYQTPPAKQAYVSIADQARLLAEVASYVYKHPRINTLIWYSLYDDSDPNGFQAGLYYTHDRCGQRLCPKPALAVFRHTVWSSAPKNGVVELWGQARLEPAKTRIFVRDKGKAGWRAYRNPSTNKTGTVRLKMRISRLTEVMVCDIYCGPIRTVSPAKGKTQRQKAARLDKKASLKRGVGFNLNCDKCWVKSTIVAQKGRASGVKAARKKSVVVARGRVSSTKSGKRVMLRFTPTAKRDIAAVKRSKLVVRTEVTTKMGVTTIFTRQLTLN